MSDAPEGWPTVTPRIVASDPAALVRFLRDVFGAAGELPEGRPAEMRLGDSVLMISGATERDLFPAFLYVYVGDADATYARAIDAGAVSMEAVWETPYGDRRGMVRDPWGNVWQIAARRRP